MQVLRRADVKFEYPAYSVGNEKLPKNTYIVSIPPAQKIIFNPDICGNELRRYSLECSRLFLRAAWAVAPRLRKISLDRICELVMLRGSLGYCLDQAFQLETGQYLPRCFIGVKRRRISGGEFEADVFYVSFDALPDNGFLFAGETIATGATLSQALATTRSELRERDYDVKGLIFFTIAGSAVGAEKLREWESRFREWWPNFRVYLIASEALFGLGENGTDLLFRREGAIVPEETKERVSRIYGDYEKGYLPGKICAIFDWGDRNFRPTRHLEDLANFCREHLRVAKEGKAREVLRSLLQRAMRKKKEFTSRIVLR
ncbi:MAG: hypothetical protein QW179_01515 [Candidatus Hadarchaeales archaeon]